MTVIGEQSTSAKSEIRTKCDLLVFSRTLLLFFVFFIQIRHNSMRKFVTTLQCSGMQALCRKHLHAYKDTCR